jgi:hypothetical protein
MGEPRPRITVPRGARPYRVLVELGLASSQGDLAEAVAVARHHTCALAPGSPRRGGSVLSGVATTVCAARFAVSTPAVQE